MREWLWRVKARLFRKRFTAEKAEEMQHHVDLEIEEGLRQGLPPDEARRRARQRAGLVSEGVEAAREAYGIGWLDGAALDLRHAIRSLTRNRKYGAVAVLVLSASVAISTLIFCMLEGLVLRPLPYATPSELVRLYDESEDTPRFPLSMGHYLDFRGQARSLASIALYTENDLELTADAGASQRLTGLSVTGDYFAVLGTPLARGRAFVDGELRQKSRAVIISHRLWEDRFGSDPDIVGRTIRIDREPWTVVGVAAAGFQHVGGDYRSPMQGETVDVWIPLPLDLPEKAIRNYHFTNAVARLAPGVTAMQAKQELDVMVAAALEAHPESTHWRIRVAPLLDEVTGRSRDLVWLLVAAGALVLLLACVNIAGLSVARAVSRQRELSLRRALGANGWQLVRVGLAENLVIGVVGAVLGLGLVAVGMPLLRGLLPADFPRAHEIQLTVGSALFAVLVAVGTALVAGIRRPSKSSLQSDARIASSRELRRLRTVLVAGEFALAGILCAGALFLLRSYEKIGARDHGFDPTGVLTFQISVPTLDRLPREHTELLEAIGRVPGVLAVGATTNLPWSGYDENTGFQILGTDAKERGGARYQAASPGYFEAVGMRLRAGRFFDKIRDAKDQPPTVMVNDELADHYFPNGDAVGRQIKIGDKTLQIVGVVGGIKDTPADLDTKPAFWFSLGQSPFTTVFFAVRSSADPTTLVAPVRAAVLAVDGELAFADVRTLERRAAAAMSSRRFALSLFQAFSVLALLLAGAGIYGLLAYVVQQRRKELGIRVALGATPRALARMIMGDGLKMAGAGAILCVALIPVGGKLLQGFLYEVGSFDVITVVAAPILLLGAALLASVGPARSATRSDPAVVLRDDAQ